MTCHYLCNRRNRLGVMEPSSKQLSDSISIKFDNLHPLSSDCCIYRVPEYLCSINREAYRPLVVSIGPFHYKDERLRAMEEHKLRYLKYFLNRTKNRNLEDYVNFVKEREELVRKCYAEEFTLNSGRFVEMVLVDAAFIIELFLRYCDNEDLSGGNDIIFGRPRMLDQVLDDIRLEENQLPFFIIRALYDFARDPDCPSFLVLTCKFFEFEGIELLSEPKHFVDFLRESYLPSPPPPRADEYGERPFCFNVAYLHEAGVKFELAKEGSSLLDITFDGGVLKIPKITIVDSTESIWRNLMVFEQCH
ncbi:hypothetical protein Ancab_022674 [Ancistrocladus abbreviatus]